MFNNLTESENEKEHYYFSCSCISNAHFGVGSFVNNKLTELNQSCIFNLCVAAKGVQCAIEQHSVTLCGLVLHVGVTDLAVLTVGAGSSPGSDHS